jgi:DNA polymerase-1
MQATRKDALRLFHEGSLVLAQIEHDGLRIDTEHLDKSIKWAADKEKDLEKELQQTEVWTIWQNEFKQESNIDSPDQFIKVFFDILKFPITMWTSGGKTGKDKKPSTEVEHLEDIDHPFVPLYLKRKKLEKTRGTYLKGIKREVDDNGFLHPSFNLVSGDDERGGAASYRSSCSQVNFQNMPIRDEEQGEIIRKCFIPREGNVLLEVDYGGIEVRISYAYNQDPVLGEYLRDKTKDMHRDMAAECYLLDFTNWKPKDFKTIRYCSKNQFVFPQFYGSVYFQCAPALWKSIKKHKLTLPNGVSLKEHLAEKGIYSLGECNQERTPVAGTFEHHIWKVQQDFWGRRFQAYEAWKKRFFKEYQQKGYFDSYTGFRYTGVYKRNAVVNYPIQGSAFHCMLWSIIEIQKFLRKNNLLTKIVGQIHDSVLLDGPRWEIERLLPHIKRISTQKIRKVWTWINVDLEVEADIVDENKSWSEKHPIPI